MVELVMAVPNFACVYLGENIELEILVQHVQQAAKRIYRIAEFHVYVVADGIEQVLYSSRGGLSEHPPLAVPCQRPLLPLLPSTL